MAWRSWLKAFLGGPGEIYMVVTLLFYTTARPKIRQQSFDPF